MAIQASPSGSYKVLTGGRQPASLTPVSTELKIWGTEESLFLPLVTSTKVGEVKERLAQKLGIESGSLTFVAKQGCSFRTQADHEEIRRKITVKGVKSFRRARTEYDEPMAIIGAGHIGLRHAMWLLKHGPKQPNFVVFDKHPKVGGTSWWDQANKTSKLQTELGTYHLQFDEDNPPPTNMKTWPSRDELLEHFSQVAEEYGIMPYCRMCTSVTKVITDKKETYLTLHLQDTDGKSQLYDRRIQDAESEARQLADADSDAPEQPTEKFRAACIFMYPGNLTVPKTETYKGEDVFDAPIGYGIKDEFDYDCVTGKNVVIVGHGAFAVENVRTCVEFGAKKVYLVCRKRNLACPRVVSWFANQSSQYVPGAMYVRSMEPMYNLIGYDPWSYHSVVTNEKRSVVSIVQKARFGIGDFYFLAIYMQKCEVIEDGIQRLSQRTVHLNSGRRLPADGLLKLFGFSGAFENDQLLGIKEMVGWWPNGDNRKFIAAEPIGVHAQNFGSTSLSPGAIAWVEVATHMMDYPRDWRELLASGLLPTRKAQPEIDRPAYVLDAQLGLTIGVVVPQFCPQIAERGIRIGSWLKQTRQRECHPTDAFMEEVAAEWADYARKWKEEDDSLPEPPPYPYSIGYVKGLLGEMEGLEEKLEMDTRKYIKSFDELGGFNAGPN